MGSGANKHRTRIASLRGRHRVAINHAHSQPSKIVPPWWCS